jgi:thioredoxin reductase
MYAVPTSAEERYVSSVSFEAAEPRIQLNKPLVDGGRDRLRHARRFCSCAGSSNLIENYLGFPDGPPGAMLAERGRQQAAKSGAELLLLRLGVLAAFYDDGITATLEDGSPIRAHANICATGIGWRRLNVPGGDDLLGRGV